jgi:hypothetical protein
MALGQIQQVGGLALFTFTDMVHSLQLPGQQLDTFVVEGVHGVGYRRQGSRAELSRIEALLECANGAGEVSARYAATAMQGGLVHIYTPQGNYFYNFVLEQVVFGNPEPCAFHVGGVGGTGTTILFPISFVVRYPYGIA